MDDLILQIQQGNHALMETLWLQVHDLVAWWAKRYYTAITTSGTALGGVEIDDLIQAGYLALVAAVEGHDPAKGSFTTYLAFHIKKEFRLAIGRSHRQLHDPLNWCRSYDEPAHKDEPDGPTKGDYISDPVDRIEEADERVFQEQLHAALERALDTLPAKEAAAIRSEFWDGCKQWQTAEKLNVSQSRVEQLKRDGFRHIRNSSAGKQLERFLDENTSFYHGHSCGAFNSTKSSGVERAVIRREYLREKYKGLFDDISKQSDSDPDSIPA